MKATLVKIDVAAAALGWSAAKLFDLVEGGSLLEPGFEWVFNLANDVHGERRDLRWWWQEIEERRAEREEGKSKRYELREVIDQILPVKRTNFHAGEVDQMFQIRPRTRIDLHDELSVSQRDGHNFYSRYSLAAFLRRRWVGAAARPGHREADSDSHQVPLKPAALQPKRNTFNLTAPEPLHGADTL